MLACGCDLADQLQSATGMQHKHCHPSRIRKTPSAILISAPPGYEFTGTLLGASKAGFQIQCDAAELRTGDRVGFRHSRGTGWAVVVWTRIVSQHVEAGFQITADRRRQAKS
jgi:hypothetical protein